MLKIFTGDDRIRAQKEIIKLLGSDYETIDGANLTSDSLPSIFYGNSLFANQRNILIRDLSVNKPVYDQLPNYLDTPHNIIIQEIKIDKRSNTYKAIKDKIEIKDFNIPENPSFRKVFDIYKIAKTNGPKAVEILEEIKYNEDPIMFFGLIVSQAIKEYAARQGTKEKRTLKELAKLDLQLKTTSHSPWLLIESFLLRFSSL